MTPDTTAYMLAGFAIIFAGIILYVVSLFTRKASVKHQVELLTEYDPSSHLTEPLP